MVTWLIAPLSLMCWSICDFWPLNQTVFRAHVSIFPLCLLTSNPKNLSLVGKNRDRTEKAMDLRSVSGMSMRTNLSGWAYERTTLETYWNASRGGPQKRSKGWNTSPVRTGCESWCCSAWRREGSRETSLQPFFIHLIAQLSNRSLSNLEIRMWCRTISKALIFEVPYNPNYFIILW